MKNKVSINHVILLDTNPVLTFRTYKCKHCGKTTKRASDKQWIKSYCDEIGKNVRLMLVKA